MLSWIGAIGMIAWLFYLEIRVRDLKDDSYDHNEKIARQREKINMLQIQVDALNKYVDIQKTNTKKG